METFLILGSFLVFVALSLFGIALFISVMYHAVKQAHEDRQTLVQAAKTIVEKNKA